MRKMLSYDPAAEKAFCYTGECSRCLKTWRIRIMLPAGLQAPSSFVLTCCTSLVLHYRNEIGLIETKRQRARRLKKEKTYAD